jgi:hypothetical protein
MSRATFLTVTGLVLAAIGMLVEIGAGSDLYPTLSGPIVLLVTAAIVALRPGRWTGYIGFAVPLVLGAGLIISAVVSPGFVDQLIDMGNPAILVGSFAHVVGLTVAVAGASRLVVCRGRETTDSGGEEQEVNAL